MARLGVSVGAWCLPSQLLPHRLPSHQALPHPLIKTPRCGGTTSSQIGSAHTLFGKPLFRSTPPVFSPRSPRHSVTRLPPKAARVEATIKAKAAQEEQTRLASEGAKA